MNYYKIGNFIADLRKEKNLTQKDLANILYVTDRAISKWERGKGCPDISLLDNLSKALDVSIIEILKGERMNKKEQVKNNELIYSMNYAEINMKEKINSIVNTVVITIIAFIFLLLLFYNLKIIVYLNESYYPNTIYTGDSELFNNVKNNLKIIRNNQGKYTEKEYKTIISFIDGISNIDDDSKLYSKYYYTFDDIKDFISTDYKNEIYHLQLSTMDKMYDILVKYNDDVDVSSDFYNSMTEMERFINNFYKYDYRFSSIYNYEPSSIGNYMKHLLYEKYSVYNRILTYIVDGGDLSE